MKSACTLVRGARCGAWPQRVDQLRFLQLGVDAVQLAVEQVVVVAELSSCELANSRISSAACAPASVSYTNAAFQVGTTRSSLEVRQAVAQHFVALLPAQRLAFTAQQQRDRIAVPVEERVARERLVERGHGKDDIVFDEESIARAGERGAQAVDRAAAAVLGLPLHVGVVDRGLSGCDEIGPGSTERLRERERKDTVVEQLQAQLPAVDRAEIRGGPVDDERRLLILDVRRGGRFRGKLRGDRRSADQRRDVAERDGLGDVEEVEDRDGASSDRGHAIILGSRRHSKPVPRDRGHTT